MSLFTALWNALTGSAAAELTQSNATPSTTPGASPPPNPSPNLNRRRRPDYSPSTPAKRRKKNPKKSSLVENEADENICAPGPSRSSSPSTAPYDPPQTPPRLSSDGWDDAVDANETTIVATDDQYETPTKTNYRAQAARQQAETRKLKKLNWRDEDIELYTHIDMRGREPLLPRHWEMDLRTLPLELFTNNEKLMVINSLRLPRPPGFGDSSDFRAIRALQALIDIGPRVRDKILCRMPPEPAIFRAVTAYVKWSLLDAGIYKRSMGWLPVLHVMKHKPHTPFKGLSDRMAARWERMAHNWRTVLQSTQAGSPTAGAESSGESDAAPALPPPPLYGIIVSYTILAIVAYVPEEEEEEDAAGPATKAEPEPEPEPEPDTAPAGSDAARPPPTANKTKSKSNSKNRMDKKNTKDKDKETTAQQTPPNPNPNHSPKPKPKPKPKPLRRVATFDFALAHYDVWNALAVAIALCHCRNVMVRYVAGRDFGDVGVRIVEEPDVDA